MILARTDFSAVRLGVATQAHSRTWCVTQSYAKALSCRGLDWRHDPALVVRQRSQKGAAGSLTHSGVVCGVIPP